MKVEIITIGDEILIGQIVDTNSAFMADLLYENGFEVVQISSIPDSKEHIVNALSQAENRADVILITGGLGPTKDDITKITLAEYFNSKLEFRQEIFNDVQERFSSLNIPMPKINRGQAEIPANAIHLTNKKGTAPGMWFEENKKTFISMPGVPYEMKYLMKAEVIPILQKKYKTKELIYKTVFTQGIGESSLMEIIGDWESELLNQNLSLAWLPSMGRVRLRISARGEDKVLLENKIESEISKLKLLVPDFFVGVDIDEIEVELARLLIDKKWTLSTAESCTGGYIAHKITAVAGSSAYFEGSIVSYSNKIKETLLGVSWQSIKEHDVVSKQVVEEMVSGVKNKFGTDCAIATTGIAGPAGGTKEIPIGTVWIAVSTPEKTISKCFHFGKDRDKNIVRSAQSAMRMLQKELMEVS